jgi:hypothetical protein
MFAAFAVKIPPQKRGMFVHIGRLKCDEIDLASSSPASLGKLWGSTSTQSKLDPLSI